MKIAAIVIGALICVLLFLLFLVCLARFQAVSKMDTATQERPHCPRMLLDIRGNRLPTMEVSMEPALGSLSLTLPSKGVSDSFPRLGELLGRLAAGSRESTTLAQLYEILAEILSCNTQKMNVSTETAQEIFAPDEAVALLADYMDFVAAKLEEKN